MFYLLCTQKNIFSFTRKSVDEVGAWCVVTSFIQSCALCFVLDNSFGKNEDGSITFAGLVNNGLFVIGVVVGICGYLYRIYVRSVLIFRNLFRN